ncbi:hypothetical protein RclHR1_01250011 [Rhizophagus clarus]|nr:hypothetical protein RclHR1_01250011 [Rhizophagus clarus]
MGTDGSAGNFIHHLMLHVNFHKIMWHGVINNNPFRKSKLNEKFVGIIVKDIQQYEVSIRDDEGFREFIKELGLLYELLTDKNVNELLVDGYKYCKQEIVRLFEQGIISCSFTLDLWTSKSQAGYLGVTCSFVNVQFEPREAILGIKIPTY